MDRRTFLITTLASAIASPSPSLRRDDEVSLVQSLLRRPRDVQTRIANAARKSVAELASPWLAATREYATAATRLLAVKVHGLVRQAPRREEPGPFTVFPCALRHEYLWGHRAVVPVEKRPPLVARAGKETVTVPLGSPVEEILALLRGLPPDLDLALAGAQAELDRTSAADAFALFLESWRNGQESFYRALDRTAGTKDSVFYFDAMLSEFQAKFAPKGASELKSLQQLHDALHDGFLAYRQYRALREAAACIAVLPPSVPLPNSLTRYDHQGSGYALRDDLTILCALDRHDPRPGLHLVRDRLAPLPDPLCATKGKYDAMPPLQKAFEERLATAIAATTEGNISSDGLRTAAIAERKKASSEIAELTRAACDRG